ncbi:MAG: hypothetical protein Rubg2KO_16030 [Rubricoccaceae bacterium]
MNRHSGRIFDSEFEVWNNWTVPSGEDWEWSTAHSVGAPTLKFKPGKGLTVNGDLDINGMILTAENASQGWKGITYNDGGLGAVSVLEDVAISGVKNGTAGYAVYVNNGDVILRGATEIDGSGGDGGIYVTGSDAWVRVLEESEISDHNNGFGIMATSGALTEVDGADVSISDNQGGIKANGTGTDIMVLGGTIENNTSTGAVGAYAGAVNFCDGGSGLCALWDPSQLQLRMLTNSGGLAGGYGAFLGSSRSASSFADNGATGGSYDAYATLGATIDAEYAWWGVGTIHYSYYYSGLDIWPYLTSNPYSGLLTESPIDGQSPQIAAIRSAETPGSQGGTPERPNTGGDRPNDPFHKQIVSAEHLRAAGKVNEAARVIEDLLQEATTESERGIAASTAVRLLGNPRIASGRTVLHDWAEARAEKPGVERPWALQLLTAAHLNDESGQESKRYAQQLVNENGVHSLFAHNILARLATERGDETEALAHLQSLAALNIDAASDAARGMKAVFPGADTEGILRFARSEAAIREATQAINAESTSNDLRVLVQPNPVSETATLVVLDQEEVKLTTLRVYDALGRQVIERAGDDMQSQLDVSALPTGVYILRALLADGRTASSRFTVTR